MSRQCNSVLVHDEFDLQGACDEPHLIGLRTLTDHIDPSLLRGVCTVPVLRGMGRAFATTTGSTSASQDDYNCSMFTSRLDDFISHDWSSGRWKKTLALLWIYNGEAAVVSSMITATVVCLCQIAFPTLLPRPFLYQVQVCGEKLEVRVGLWSTVFAPLSYFAFLFFWQRIRSTAGLSLRILFVDKFCVDQVNEQHKSAAILGLAGFLRHSERLVICWTPSYFTRLWTIYEIASWIHLQKSPGSIGVQHVAQTIIILVGVLALTTYYLLTPYLKQVLSGTFLGTVLAGMFGYVASNSVASLCLIHKQLK